MTCKPAKFWRSKLGVELPDGNTPYLVVEELTDREYAVLEERECDSGLRIKVAPLWCDDADIEWLSEEEFENRGFYQPERGKYESEV